MKRLTSLLTIFLIIVICETSSFAAAWSTCNGVPVRPKYMPMGIFWDLCSMPENSPQQRAFFSGMYETRNYVHALGFGSGFTRIHNGRCIIEHDNDRSDAAIVARADIDGALGLTVIEDDGCTFDWEEKHIITADVMVSSDLNFQRADESTVITRAPAGTRIGALVFLHELGHALGLEHTSQFAVMRDGLGARAPFVGMMPSSGGLSSELVGDDVHGISRIYGFNPSYRNVFVTSQVLRNGMLVDNNINPGNGAVHPDPLRVCPGEKVNFFASVGNNSNTTEQFDVAVYADADANAYYFPNPSETLASFTVRMGRGINSFPVEFTVPSSVSGNIQHIYVAIPTSNLWERKGYDNAARSRLRIQRRAGC